MTAPAYTDFLTDLAAHLSTNGVGRWNPTGIYPTGGLPPIYLGALPDEAGIAVCLNEYGDDRWRDPTTADKLVQIRVRGDRDPRTATRIADHIFSILHHQSSYVLNNRTRVLSSHRHLRAPEERDTNMRWHKADSYTLTLNP